MPSPDREKHDGNIASYLLIIEDDRDVAELIACFLAQVKFRPTIASNGADGLQQARTILPSLILCDSCMPGLDGLEVIKAVREEATTEHIPIVLMSGHDAARFDGSEATTFLPKPFQMNEMVATVQRFAQQLEVVSAEGRETDAVELEHA
jgi:DNA-binding response OmpR family regulator